MKAKTISNRAFALAFGALLVSLILIVAFVGCGVSDGIPPKDAIGAEEAQSIALQHAGFQPSEVRMDRADYDFDDGVPTYEIEFRKDTTEYEYTIHALTGEILYHQTESVYD